MSEIACARCGLRMYSGEMHSCSIEQQRHEVERLKAALREIHTCDAVDYRRTVRSIAYDALEGKP